MGLTLTDKRTVYAMESEDTHTYNNGYRCIHGYKKILSLSFDKYSTDISVCSLVLYVRFVRYAYRTHL